jgi:hypothetical protein
MSISVGNGHGPQNEIKVSDKKMGFTNILEVSLPVHVFVNFFLLDRLHSHLLLA